MLLSTYIHPKCPEVKLKLFELASEDKADSRLTYTGDTIQLYLYSDVDNDGQRCMSVACNCCPAYVTDNNCRSYLTNLVLSNSPHLCDQFPEAFI